MPEHAQLAVTHLAVRVGGHGLVHAQVLVVAGEDLRGLGPGVVEQDEVLEQVHERALVAHAQEHRVEIDRARVALGEALPLVEELVLAAERPDLGLEPVGEHHERVEVEELRDGVLVVGVVVLVGAAHVLVVPLELNEQQGYAVHEAHQVGPLVVDPVGAVHPHLLDGGEAVVLRVLEVEDLRLLGVGAPVVANELHRDAVAQHLVLLLVSLQGRVGRERRQQGVGGLLALLRIKPLVQLGERIEQLGAQHDLTVARAPECAVLPELFFVPGVDKIPAKRVQPVSCWLLDSLFL